MNIYECMETFKSMYPGKNILFEFDNKCHRTHEIVYENGVPNPLHHIENNKVRVTVEDMDPIYVPIQAHRETCTWSQMKTMINSCPSPYIEVPESKPQILEVKI